MAARDGPPPAAGALGVERRRHTRLPQVALHVLVACCCSLAAGGVGGGGRGVAGLQRADRACGEALASLVYEDGVVYLQIAREGGGEEGADSVSQRGWAEVWQEGHRLLLNVTEDDVSFKYYGGDTYMWASVFDGAGRWVGESNVLNVEHPLPSSLEIIGGRGDQAWADQVVEWPEDETLHVEFRASLLPPHTETDLDAVIVVIDNQTQGMLRLGSSGHLTPEESTKTWRHTHEGQIEPGLHRLQLAGLEPTYGITRILSNTVWFRVKNILVPNNPSLDVLSSSTDTSLDGSDCFSNFSECILAAEERVPANRQYTELLDAADSCALKHCSLTRQAKDEQLLSASRPVLKLIFARRAQAVFEGIKVPENLLRVARVLLILEETQLALRALRTALRIVGYRDKPQRAICTYPGCQEIAKDTCGIMHRFKLHKNGQDVGTDSVQAYMSHLDALIPPPNPEPLPKFQYPLSSICFAVLTTKPNYRTRAATVKRTWWKGVESGYFYGDESDDELPITPFATLEGDDCADDVRQYLTEWVMRADYMSSMPKFMLTLLDMSMRHADADWYFVLGDDNFVVPQHLPRVLQGLDSSERIIAGGPLGQHLGLGNYPSGGSGILFSKGFMKAARLHMIPFAVSWIAQRGKRNLCHPCGDIAFGNLAKDIGASVVELPCMHGMWPEYFALHQSDALPWCASVVGVAPQSRVNCGDPVCFHYVQPRAMELLHHYFSVHRGASSTAI